MRNLLISIAVSIVSYGVGHYFGGSWLAGIPTAILGFVIPFFLLIRSSMNKLQELSKRAMAAVQSGQESQDPAKMMKSLEDGISIFKEGLSLAKHQFLLKEIIYAQMGALCYQGASVQMQMRMGEEMKNNRVGMTRHQTKANQLFGRAKEYLSQAHAKDWVLTIIRNWQGPGMLAAMEYRDGHKEAALERIGKCKSVGKSDPLFWGVYAWMLHENDRGSDALIAANEGLDKNPSSAPLKRMIDSISNQKEIDTLAFGMMWYSIFPEQLTVSAAMKLQQEAQSMGANGPSDGPNRKMRRMMKKKGY
jgi:hypothetical protein